MVELSQWMATDQILSAMLWDLIPGVGCLGLDPPLVISTERNTKDGDDMTRTKIRKISRHYKSQSQC